MRKLQIIPISDMEIFRKMFYNYLTELSKFDASIKFNEKGEPVHKWFDCYWEDKDRFPLLLNIEDKIAGFALIRELSNKKYEIAEFYVCPDFRKDGNAIWFANEIANLFEGQFVFSTTLTNTRAIKFWDKFVLQFKDNTCYKDETFKNWTIRKEVFKNHTLNLKPKYFNLIKNEEKILEGRLNDEKRQNFNISDTITFYKEPEREETIDAIILNKYIYKDFDEMASDLDKKDLGFKDATIEEMIHTYRTIYSKENESKYGVVIFKIKVMS